jgi:hypothetical protein
MTQLHRTAHGAVAPAPRTPSPSLLIPTAGKVLITLGWQDACHTPPSDRPIPHRPNPRGTVRGIVGRES